MFYVWQRAMLLFESMLQEPPYLDEVQTSADVNASVNSVVWGKPFLCQRSFVNVRPCFGEGEWM